MDSSRLINIYSFIFMFFLSISSIIHFVSVLEYFYLFIYLFIYFSLRVNRNSWLIDSQQNILNSIRNRLHNFLFLLFPSSPFLTCLPYFFIVFELFPSRLKLLSINLFFFILFFSLLSFHSLSFFFGFILFIFQRNIHSLFHSLFFISFFSTMSSLCFS